LLAQVVIMLRPVFFRSGGLVLIFVKLNRIYAVTRKNRIIVSCLGVITISQFGLGLYATAYAVKAGCESVIKRRPQLPPTSPFQRRGTHRFHFRFI